MHGGHACGAVEWMCPELIFETRVQRVVVAVPTKGGDQRARCLPTKAQLATSMLLLDAITSDRWHFPKAADVLFSGSSVDYERQGRQQGSGRVLGRA